MKLGEICEYQQKSKHKAGEGLEQGLYPFFTSSNILSKYMNSFDYDGEYLIFGTGGKASANYYNGKFATSTDNFVVKFNCCMKFLWHYFQGNMQVLERGFKGASIRHISKDYIKDIDISFPSLHDQQCIVEEFDTVCGAIAKQKEQLELCNTLIKSKFNEMFGDPIKNDKGWKQESIKGVCELLIAGGDKPQDFSKEQTVKYQYPVYSNGETNGGLLCYSKKFRIDKQAITISARGTIGYCAIREPKFTPIVRLITIIPNKKMNIVFLKNLIDNTKIEKTGASQGQLTIPMVGKIKVYLPHLEIQQQFADFVNQVEQNKKKIKQGLNQTETLYKALMQKCFGENE
jgi:type I restriction enzyme S subunit